MVGRHIFTTLHKNKHPKNNIHERHDPPLQSRGCRELSTPDQTVESHTLL
jgi:hypothetical protein